MTKHAKILVIITMLQFISTFLIYTGWYEPKYFTLAHEDFIFMGNLMTLFIVIAIDNLKKATL